MINYIIRRVLQMILVLLLVTLVVFVFVRALPGDPVLMYLISQKADTMTPQQIANIKHDLGLDKPMIVQYFDWLGNVVTGDLGKSLVYETPVINDIKKRLPVTLYIGLLSFIIAIIIGIPMGAISAIRRGSWVDSTLTSFGNLGICIPIFWLGILLIYLFSLKLGWLPSFGYTSPFKDFSLNIKQIIMPVFCMSIPEIASSVRLTRSSMLEVLQQDYIRTAYSKGLLERYVIVKHALKNSLVPVVTLKGMSLGSIVGGAVLIETVFSIPGMGRLAVQSLFAHDYVVIQGVMLVIGVVLLAANLLVDLSYGWLDPRIQYK
ncbi:MAG: ABC transporter permease [Dehalococcoidales bacterium]|nr:ABC transporter permease [Dehalococcoidales bacterium]